MSLSMADLFRAANCPHCDSKVTVTEVAPGLYSGQVLHDDACPWFTALQERES